MNCCYVWFFVFVFVLVVFVCRGCVVEFGVVGVENLNVVLVECGINVYIYFFEYVKWNFDVVFE